MYTQCMSLIFFIPCFFYLFFSFCLLLFLWNNLAIWSHVFISFFWIHLSRNYFLYSPASFSIKFYYDNNSLKTLTNSLKTLTNSLKTLTNSQIVINNHIESSKLSQENRYHGNIWVKTRRDCIKNNLGKGVLGKPQNFFFCYNCILLTVCLT